MAKYRINLTVYERLELEKIIKRHTPEQQIAKRAKIIFLANGECLSNKDIASELDIYSTDITQWTNRLRSAQYA
jgi:DNA-binding NarL/FixJ family response regulator